MPDDGTGFRLDDLGRRLQNIEALVERIHRLDEQLIALAEDTRECRITIREVREGIERRAEEQRKERKSDRFLQIASATAIVSTLAGVLALILGQAV